jgi:hypothetical protein
MKLFLHSLIVSVTTAISQQSKQRLTMKDSTMLTMLRCAIVISLLSKKENIEHFIKSADLQFTVYSAGHPTPKMKVGLLNLSVSPLVIIFEPLGIFS